MRHKLCVLVILLTYLSLISVAAADEWKVFLNGRFGVSVEIPASFQGGPVPANDDGRSFSAENGTVTLLVFGGFNVLGQTPETYLNEISNNPDQFTSVEYQRQGRDWVVASGYLADNIVYQKTLFSCDGEVLSTMILTYPKSEKIRFDPIVTRMSRSLKAGRGYGTPEGC